MGNIEINMNKRESLVEVYRAGGETEAQVIRGLLENCGIPCLLKSHAAPSVHVLTIDGMGETKVMVWESTAEKARELIEGEGYA